MSGVGEPAITAARVRAYLAAAEDALRAVDRLLSGPEAEGLAVRALHPQLRAAAAVATTARITAALGLAAEPSDLHNVRFPTRK